MKRFTNAVEAALENGNWYGALAISLTLPDVCGRLETPDDPVGKRYVRWFEGFMNDKYSMPSGLGRHVFLTGQDCYLLRCSYLHEGGGSIAGKAKAVLEHFHFISPPGNGNSYHKIQNNRKLLLQVDRFCQDMVDAVNEWEKLVSYDADIAARKLALLTIHDASGAFNF